jgi:hypothetical protein
MADATAVPEFQVHIEGHFCDHHQPLIKIFEIKGSGLLVRAELVASFPEGEEANVMNDLQRYEIDMAGHDMPTEIIAGIMGVDALQKVMDREVLGHTSEANEWVAKLALGNLAAALLDTTGGLAGSYL